MKRIVTIDINDPDYRTEEIVDDGKPWKDEGPLKKILVGMYREHLAREGGSTSCATPTTSTLKRPTAM